MRSRLLTGAVICALAACQGGETTRPSAEAPGPSFRISDGAHRQSFNDPNGNPDFFFLPTMVPNPINDTDFDPDDFNPKLLPTVEICNLPGTLESE
ncbi:MAG TPA: hypothetical protein VGQ17_06345, partial [Gemmatimonadales bacterium]|nr:hypothetical protein [Gemmatimonadales bacterium]